MQRHPAQFLEQQEALRETTVAASARPDPHRRRDALDNVSQADFLLHQKPRKPNPMRRGLGRSLLRDWLLLHNPYLPWAAARAWYAASASRSRGTTVSRRAPLLVPANANFTAVA